MAVPNAPALRAYCLVWNATSLQWEAAQQPTAATGGFAYGGDGSDSALVYDGTTTILGMAPVANLYTLTRDIFATSITVNAAASIKTNNFAIFCTGTLTCNGTIKNDGTTGDAGTNALNDVGGGGGTLTVGAGLTTARYKRQASSIAGTSGGSGATGAGAQAGAANSGNNASAAIDTSGGSGVTGSAGGKGGTGTGGAGGASRAGGSPATVTNTPTQGRNIIAAATGSYYNAATVAWSNYTTQNAGNGGSAGGSGGGGDGANKGGGGGGGGGEGGYAGTIGIFAQTIVVGSTGLISSIGGTGGKGGNGRTQAVGNVGGGGGGAGGSGGQSGIIFLVYHTLTNNGSISVVGGTAGAIGTKGSPFGTGTDDAADGIIGATGPAGLVIQLVI